MPCEGYHVHSLIVCKSCRVNLVHDGKLRKLRNSYAESTVLGDQYSRKLRTQFTNLSSIPTWASDEEKTLSGICK
jgi:hypothetical protein